MPQQALTWDFLFKQNTLYSHKSQLIKLTYFSLGIIFDKLLFSDRLLYVGKGNDYLNKSKSMGLLKAGHSMISPVYQLNATSQISIGKIDETKPLQFPKMKL